MGRVELKPLNRLPKFGTVDQVRCFRYVIFCMLTLTMRKSCSFLQLLPYRIAVRCCLSQLKSANAVPDDDCVKSNMKQCRFDGISVGTCVIQNFDLSAGKMGLLFTSTGRILYVDVLK